VAVDCRYVAVKDGFSDGEYQIARRLGRKVTNMAGMIDSRWRGSMCKSNRKRDKQARILFLWIHNSCRSQIAEGWTHHLYAHRFEPRSAGIDPTRVDLYAVKVMAEARVDISSQRSKSIRGIQNIGFDYVVTVCDGANEQCPCSPARVRMIHADCDDPAGLAKEAGDQRAILAIYRRIRDKIRRFVEELPRTLEAKGSRPPRRP
jgi:arsenate reductase